MASESPNPNVSSAQGGSKAAGAAILAVGTLVLAGWWLNIDILKSILPGAPVMKANAALAFIFAGLGLWLLQTNTTNARLLVLRRVCAGLVALIGLLTLAEYVLGWQLGIDQLLALDNSVSAGLFPGRSAALTAVSFVLSGLALLLLDVSGRFRLAQLLALAAGLVALLATLGYLYGADSLYRPSAGNAMALHTAITFLLLSLGLLFARPTDGWMAMVTSHGAAGTLARRLLPAAVIIPVVMGWLRLQGQIAGFYDTRFGLALFATANIIVFTALIAASASSLFRTDMAREQAENKISRLNADLELRVLERTSQLTAANQQLETEVAERERAEAKFRALLEAAPDAMVIINPEGKIVLVNSQAENLFGYPRAALLGQSVERLVPQRFHGQDFARRAGQFTGRAAHPGQGGPDLFGLRQDGSEFPVEMTMSTIDTADGVLLSSAVRDITQRKRAEQELQRLKTALDQMAEGAQIISPDWRYMYLNDAAASQGQHAKEELLGHTMMEMYPGIDGTPLFDIMRRCMDQRVSDHMENPFTFPDNTTGWFDLSIQPTTEGIFILSTDITARKRAEAALRESEERFAKAFQSSPAALTITRLADGFFIDVNETFLTLFGYSREETVGQRAPELGINTNPEERADLARQLRDHGSVHNHEIVLRTKAGELRNMQLSADAMELDGQAHILTTMIDITSRKRAEAALRDSEAKLRALFEVLPVGITILDRERRILDVNPALERILAISKGRLTEGDYSGLKYIHPDGTAVRLEELPSARVFATQQAVLDFEMGVVLETGRTVWTSVSAVPVPAGGLGAVVVTTDITERREIEAALAQERDLLQALLDNVPDTIYFKDTASRFTRINLAQARVLGVADPRDAYGKTDADFQAPNLAAEFNAEEQRIFQTGQPVIDRQEYNTTRDGRDRWFSATKVAITDRQGRVQGLIGISRDITQRIQAEEGQRQANAALTERVGQMSLLHELEEQLQACLTVAEVYQVTARLSSQLFADESGALYVINSSRNWVETASAWGAVPPKSQVFGLDDCWALRRGRIHLSGQAHPTQVVCGHLKGEQPALSVCIPMLAQGETLGILHLRSARGLAAPRFDDNLLQLTRVVADSVALAMANLNLREKLRQQSIRDPLTNLYNRRYMEESLERELLLAARRGRAVGVIMLDVDNFKQVNDLYGHSAGDAVLRQLGRYLTENTRGGDIACRYGGEEFTLILPEANLEQSRLRAEQHRLAFKALPFEHSGHPMAVITLSFGIAAFPDNGQTGEDLLSTADTALYHAKHEGRDRVVIAQGTASAGQTV